MAQPKALEHLRHACKPASENISDADLINEWNAARAKLGVGFPNAGNPEIRALPAANSKYESNFFKEKSIAAALRPFPKTTIKLIEVDPLLAYQFVIDKARSNEHCGALKNPPSLEELLKLCLPTTLPQGRFPTSRIDPNSKSVIITTPNHNLRSLAHGVFDVNMDGVLTKIGGVRFQENLPFVHVVRYEGKCFLYNGYHRVLGIRAAGATHIPCLFRDVGSYPEAGVQEDGTTFGAQMFKEANAPTVGHFTQGRAYEVNLRRFSRIIHVSWAEYSMPAE